MAKFDCCIGCVPPKRNAWCHSTCKEYLGDRDEHEAERARIRQKDSGDKDYTDFKVKTVDAIKRRKLR